MTCGFLFPTFIPNWQNINNLYAWSVGFNMPTVAKDWFKKFDGFTSRRNRRNTNEIGDSTRQKFYQFVEKELERLGRSGRDCLLRVICETAEAPIRHNGLIGELAYVLFTPGDDEAVDHEYKLARRAGLYAADCMELYQGCPKGHGLFDTIGVLGYQTAKDFIGNFL